MEKNQSVENTDVAYVRGAYERNKFLCKKYTISNVWQTSGGRTKQMTNNLNLYYNTHRSIRGGSQSTPPSDKAWCIIAPIEHYSGYRHFKEKRKSCNHWCPDSVYFHTQLLIIYLSAIERLICRLLPLVLHKIWYMIFKIPYWTHNGIVFDKCHKNDLVKILSICRWKKDMTL